MGTSTQLCLTEMVTPAAISPVYLHSQLLSPTTGVEKTASSIHSISADC